MVRLASTRAINEEHDQVRSTLLEDSRANQSSFVSAQECCLQEKEDAPYTREAQMSELVRKTATLAFVATSFR